MDVKNLVFLVVKTASELYDGQKDSGNIHGVIRQAMRDCNIVSDVWIDVFREASLAFVPRAITKRRANAEKRKRRGYLKKNTKKTLIPLALGHSSEAPKKPEQLTIFSPYFGLSPEKIILLARLPEKRRKKKNGNMPPA